MLKNLKKVISTIAAVAILATSASAFAVTFPDVDASAAYASDVELLVALGVVNGDDNGKFNPDNTVTRAEFAKMVVEALGKGEAAAASSYTRFADAQGHWAAGYIEAGVAAEFINGYDENTFGPDDTVTFAQAVKMLVGAAGYESWAQQAGGWKAGYMSYGSTLGIMAGVNVAEDAALTRAECATLIANAMKAPLLVVEGYDFVGTMNGVVQVPNYEQKDGLDKDWQTMLTKYHNAYAVMGRVSRTSKDGEKVGTVQYTVEETRNLDDAAYVNGATTAVTAFVGDTKAADMLFEYTSAVLVLDEDTDKYTLASIKPYGASEKLEVAAKMVQTPIGSQIKVQKSEASSVTKDYDLEADVKVYVNGYKVDDDTVWTDTNGNGVKDAGEVTVKTSALAKAAAFVGAANPAGVVTLIDETEPGSTATNGDYDIISITATESYRVKYTRSTDTDNEIMMANSLASATLTYEPEDEDTSIVFTMDGEEIAFEDIQKDDVLTITRNPYAAYAGLEEATIVVTRNTVSGTVSKAGTDTLTVDGAEYDYALSASDKPATGSENKFYLDANGVIIDLEELETNVDYAVVTKVSYDDDAEEWKVKMIDEAGKVSTLNIKNVEETLLAFVPAVDANTNGEINETELAAAEAAPDKYKYEAARTEAGLSASVVSYKLSNGEFRLMARETASNAADTKVEYKARTSKLDSYMINEAATSMIDVTEYVEDAKDDIAAVTPDMLEDEGQYTAYVYGYKSGKAVPFVLVTSGITDLKATSDLAIVQKYVADTTVDDTDVKEYVVLKNGEAETLYVDDAVAKLKEGTVIMYKVSSRGYAKTVKKVFDMTFTSYKDMLAAALTNATVKAGFTVDGIITNAALESDSIMGLAYGCDFDNLTLISDIEALADGTVKGSKTAKAVDYAIDDANVYTYNFKNTPDNGFRVEAAAAPVDAAQFTTISDDNADVIRWDADGVLTDIDAFNSKVYAPIVLMREVENVVTDVFFFVAE